MDAFSVGDVFRVGDHEKPSSLSYVRDFRNGLIMAPTATW